MSSYISFPISRDPDEILQEAYDFLKARVPGWVENDGNLDTWLLQINAAQASDLLRIATDVPDTIFRYLGRALIGFPDVVATSASVTSTWTMRDNAGYTIPEGTQVGIPNANNDLVAFAVTSTVIVPSGSTVTVAGGVSLVAIIPGADGSALGSPGSAVTLLDPLEYVTSIVQVAATTGGVDTETDSEYRDRLTRRLRRLSTRPILPVDFSDMAQEIVGVARAVAIDGFIPPSSFNQERAVAIAGIDSGGNNLSSGKKAEIDAYIQANREVTFVCNVVDPIRYTINVTFQVAVIAGFDKPTVEVAAETAVADYLSPAKWGRDPRFSATGAETTWIETTVLYYNELIQLISNVDGVDRVVSMTYAINPNALGSAASLALAGPAALTVPGAIIGSTL